MNRIYRVIWN
ncbi:hypothetical protein BMA29_003465 [Escherichia coli]|nr:hypothetical protein [Escherichia coli]EET3390617.1 hypothetical protein [Escherichia coli]EET3802019.1 hypothetical protein [Escherichia coli]EEU2899767.1 hypothetical protein [Escherichia coli]EEW8538413.1 hypothetical protein [Escherichia coli]